MKQLTTIQFCNKLKECTKEYKKQLNDTRDDKDAAHFFNARLKKFLLDHRDELDILGTMNFDRAFMSWISNYLLREDVYDFDE
jgi:glycyl-tRNA synthetase beta subunit